eukprot:m.61861 g.61861  ORF g.61861 m.61861 type:complete len:194 (-) comp13273_c0_seq2:89-670(-)
MDRIKQANLEPRQSCGKWVVSGVTIATREAKALRTKLCAQAGIIGRQRAHFLETYEFTTPKRGAKKTRWRYAFALCGCHFDRTDFDAKGRLKDAAVVRRCRTASAAAASTRVHPALRSVGENPVAAQAYLSSEDFVCRVQERDEQTKRATKRHKAAVALEQQSKAAVALEQQSKAVVVSLGSAAPQQRLAPKR